MPRVANPGAAFRASKAADMVAGQRRGLARHFGVPEAAVREATEEEDKAGADWFVSLPDGRVQPVDVKCISAKQSQYWARKHDPELPIEWDHSDGEKGWATAPKPGVLICWCLVGDDFRIVPAPHEALALAAGPLRGFVDTLGKPIKVPNRGRTFYITRCTCLPESAWRGLAGLT